MLGEVKLAQNNTSNLMYENGLLDDEILLESLQSEFGENYIQLGALERQKNVFDKRICIPQNGLEMLREKVEEIVRELKEKN